MTNEEEVIKIAKKLDRMVAKKNTDNALDILNVLKNMSIDLETLQKTRIGMTVNSIRKQTTNDEVAGSAKQLIKSWKKLVSGPSERKKSDSGTSRNGNSSESQISSTIKSRSPTLPKPNNDRSMSSNNMETSSTLHKTNNPIRDKCREMLLKGLMTDNTTHSESRCSFVAAAIEEAIYNEFNDIGMKYKNRVRSRFSNLKDSRNSILQQNVLNGVVKPEVIAKMTAEEMASTEMKKLREAYEQENIKDHQMSVNEGTKTDMFSCGKCKSKACTYTQLQTRSSDEPMTTFVFCTACGNRWKFC